MRIIIGSLALLALTHQHLTAKAHYLDLTHFNQEFFSCIYNTNAWLDVESHSGPGSRLSQTTVIRATLPGVLQALEIKVLIDAACGDLNWLKETDLSFLEQYVGLDIVPQLIDANQKKYQSSNRQFRHLDITNDPLPSYETCTAVLCRDCISHLKYDDIKKFIANVKRSKARYLIITTYPDCSTNKDFTPSELLSLWRYRPLNLQQAPFNFPDPIGLIMENNEGFLSGTPPKALGIWFVSDLPDLQ